MNAYVCKVYVCKAAKYTKGCKIEDVELHIEKTLPTFRNSTSKEIDDFFVNEAQNIIKVLKNHLPQATMHQLLIAMLQNTRNTYEGV